jgi:subtilase family serine protease
MKKRRHFFVALDVVLLIFLVFSVSPKKAEAVLAPDYDFSSAVLKADLIVEGMVTEARSRWIDNPNGKNIFTFVRIRVDRLIKGNPIAEDVEFRVMGGTVGDITQTVSDMPAFHPGEEAIVLLSSQQGEPYILNALPGYGKVSVEKGKVSYSGSVLSVDEFVEGIKAFIEYPDSGLSQHLRSDRYQKANADRDDTEAVGVGPGKPGELKAGETPDKDDTEVVGVSTSKPAALKAGETTDQDNTEEIVGGGQTPSLRVEERVDQGQVESIKDESLSKDAAATADLQPYQRSGWDNKIVISNLTGTGTTAGTIYDDQTVYIDYGCGNYGSANAGHFRYGLYIDGTRVKYVDMSSLSAGYASYVEDSNVGQLSAGTHTFKVVCDYNYEVSESNEGNNTYSRTFTITPRTQLPDLQPYQRSNWDNKIVISNVTGTGTTAGTIYDDQTVYIDFGCGNYGSGNAGHFRYGLYIDGTRVKYVDKSSLPAGYAGYVEDSNVGQLPAGTHTFKVVCDYNYEVSESNESNNQYSRTFTISSRPQLPDLQPYQRSNWDNKIVISNVTGTGTTSGTIYDDQTVYIDYGCVNSGSGNAGHFRYGLYIDGTRVKYVDKSSLPAGYAGYIEDSNVGQLSAGTHTFKVVCDYNYEVSESNESNNEYSRTFTISSRPQLPDLQPYQRSNWDNKIVISNVTGTGTTAGTIYSDETVYIDYGCVNSGGGDAGHFRYGLYIDGTLVKYVDKSSLPAGYAGYIEDSNVGQLSAGTHTFKVVCDYNNEVSESNESNNQYSRTFTITGRGPNISSVSPNSGSAGTNTQVTINGSGFGSIIGNGRVEFWYGRGNTGDPDRIEAPIVSWSNTRIICTIPVATLNQYSASACSGPLRVTTDAGTISNEVTFIVTFSYMGNKWVNQFGVPQVSYRINENTSDCTGEGAAVMAGAGTWNNAGAAFAFKYTGTHTNTNVGFNHNNDIMWSNNLPTGVLARASRWVNSGEMTEADIAYNDQDYVWSSDDTPASTEYDIQSIIIHELGHWLSLRDLYGNIGDGVNDIGKVMYGRGSRGDLKRNLHVNDTSGIRWIYGASGPRATIWDCWWTNEVDVDGDGYVRSAKLWWDPDVTGGGGSLTIFERIYYKQSSSGSWTLWRTTSNHTITGTTTGDRQSVDINGISHAIYDWKIEVYRSGHSSADNVRGPDADEDLNDYTMETAQEDVVVTLTSLEIIGPASVNENTNTQYNAKAYFSNGSNSYVTTNCTWSENSQYAAISSIGVLTAYSVSSNQPVRITASYTYNGITKTDFIDVTIVNVDTKTLNYIVIEGPNEVNESSTQDYNCRAYYTDGTNGLVEPNWSENSSSAEISPTGMLTTFGVTSDQACQISASYTFNSVTKSDTHNITIKDVDPQITSLTPNSGPVGAAVIIAGDHFGSSRGTVTFNGVNAPINSWSETQIKTTVPTNVSTGQVVVHTAAGYDSNGVTFTVTEQPTANKADFDRDGYSDVLWRYQGPEGYNAVWLSGNANSTASEAGISATNEVRKEMNMGIGKPGMVLTNSSWETLPESQRQFVIDGFAGMENWPGNALPSPNLEAMSRVAATSVSDPRNDPQSVNLDTVADQNWKLCGTGDFNGDGHIDIVWSNVSTAQNCVWYMNGTTFAGYALLPDGSTTDWVLGGVGDFDRDGKPDLIWHNEVDGRNGVWYLDGVQLKGIDIMTTGANVNWKLCGTGDFNNDGHVDMVWRNTTDGRNAVWYMYGVEMFSLGWLDPVANQNWKLRGTGDFNNDGKIDLVWTYISDGRNCIWYLDGVTLTNVEFLTTVTDTTWEIEN